ncbi:DUF937 domain-containing protein [Mumia quercus]|uniref:DUF937 domain-containing protein n=1 Tax=Mumia quercus TaxID=2976125 RepID=UPI0021D24D71|nr:DUF937 domain-containing protein [Mumia quercus]
MARIEDLFAQIPVDQIAGMLGVDAEQVQQAAGKAVPALVEGMQANAQDPAGAASLEKALSQHGGELDGDLDAAKIDTDDGAKIVKNVFGDNVDGVAQALSGGAGAGLIQKILPMVAPLVMGFLSKQASGSVANSAAPQAGGQVDLGGLLGGLLGGGGSSNAGGGLGDLLGGLLGAGKR